MATAKKDAAYYEQSEKHEMIKSDLIDAISSAGTVRDTYVDIIDDYMSLWVTKCLLKDDIMKRGVTVSYNNGGGQKGRKKNEAVEQILKVNMQMLKLLDAIGVKPGSGPSVGNDEDM